MLTSDVLKKIRTLRSMHSRLREAGVSNAQISEALRADPGFRIEGSLRLRATGQWSMNESRLLQSHSITGDNDAPNLSRLLQVCVKLMDSGMSDERLSAVLHFTTTERGGRETHYDPTLYLQRLMTGLEKLDTAAGEAAAEAEDARQRAIIAQETQEATQAVAEMEDWGDWA